MTDLFICLTAVPAAAVRSAEMAAPVEYPVTTSESQEYNLRRYAKVLERPAPEGRRCLYEEGGRFWIEQEGDAA